MPITPVHMGAALAAKAIAPRYFSFLIFGITQVAIDTEAAFYVIREDWPYHRFLHTYLGANLGSNPHGRHWQAAAGTRARGCGIA